MKKLDPVEKKRRAEERDRGRLARFSEEFEFPRSAHAERFAFDMWRSDMLERRSEVYKVSAGGRSAELRWAYRLSRTGRSFLALSKAS